MKDFRCANCHKLLAKIEGRAEIKCPKCSRLNIGEVLKEDQYTGEYSQEIEPFNNTMLTFETSKQPKKFITYDEFDEAYKKVLPKLKEDWDKLMNEESLLAKLFDK